MRRPFFALPLLLALVVGALAGPSTTATAVEPPVIIVPFDQEPQLTLGLPAVGQTARATTTGAWSPAPTRVTYDWYLDGRHLGTNTTGQWALDRTSLGRRLAVELRAERTEEDVHRESVLRADAVVTMPAKRALKKAPALDGAPQAGGVVHLHRYDVTWSPQPESWESDYAYTFQWLLNGRVVRTSRGNTYTLPRKAKGQRLQTRVILDQPGYERAVATSRAAVVQGLTYRKRGYPEIESFLPEVGRTVRVDTDSWSPRPTRFTYQWFLNGKKIKGATKSRLKVTKRMKRKYLKVSITAHRRYYEPTTTYSTSYKVYGPNLS